jgi:hypothetical protein
VTEGLLPSAPQAAVATLSSGRADRNTILLGGEA